jgi:hypothetical protein
MGAAARKRVEQFYSLRSVLPIMTETIKEVAAKR